MEKWLSERRLLCKACLGLLLCMAPIAAIPDTSGFALGSRVNIREKPDINAAIVKTIKIGTQVRWREPENGWCKVTRVNDDSVSGYVRCDYLATHKPTLEAIDKELSEKNITGRQENDLLERRFFLSPSLNTISVARHRKKMEADDHWLAPAGKGAGKPYCIKDYTDHGLLCILMHPGSDDFCKVRSGTGVEILCDEIIKGAATKRADYEFIGTLMNDFQGEVSSEDFRPVDLRINEQVIPDLQSFIQKYRDGVAVEKDVKGSLPKVGRSLFVNKQDVLAAGVMDTWSYTHEGDELKTKWVSKRDGGFEQVSIDSNIWSFSTTSDIVEFSKFTSGQRFHVHHSPLLGGLRNEFNSFFGWYKTGGVDIEFAKPPQAVMVTKGKFSPAIVLRAQVSLVRGGCGELAGKFRKVTVKLSDQVRSGGALLLLAPHIRVADAKVIGTDTNLVIYDLNDDGIADLAHARLTLPSPIGGSDKMMFVFLNIDGLWRLGAHEFSNIC